MWHPFSGYRKMCAPSQLIDHFLVEIAEIAIFTLFAKAQQHISSLIDRLFILLVYYTGKTQLCNYANHSVSSLDKERSCRADLPFCPLPLLIAGVASERPWHERVQL